MKKLFVILILPCTLIAQWDFTFDRSDAIDTPDTVFLSLNINNKWQYIGYESSYNGTVYSLITYYVLEDTLIGNNTYYVTSFSGSNLIRYSNIDKKIYILCNDSDYVMVNFNIPPGTIYQAYLNCSSSISLSSLGGIHNLFNTDLVYGGYEFADLIGYHNTLYTDSIGMTSTDFVLGWPFYSEGGKYIIEAIVYKSNFEPIYYTYHYKPIFAITPITEISSTQFILDFQVNHHYTFVVPNPNPFNQGLNFIQNVTMYSYYSKDDSVINKPPITAYNDPDPVNIDYLVTASLDTNLLKSGFVYNYRFLATDKGIIPEYSNSPDSGYYQCIWDETTNLKEESETIPFRFTLSQNYPNPFNPTTNIEFRITDFGFVSLKVFDILGKEIATLVNEEKTAGEYEVEFDGIGLPSGVYFYQLKSGNYIETKKMLLMK